MTYGKPPNIRFTPAFSTTAVYSCIFHPCNVARIAFSTPAFSVASWKGRKSRTLRHVTSVTSPVSLDNIFALPAEVFSSCLAIVSAVMVGGLFLWPAPRYGTGYQTVWEIRPSAETLLNVHRRRFYFQLTRVYSALELSGRCALQIYLLTYLLIYLLTYLLRV